MARIVIFGNKDFAQLAHFYLTHDSEHDVVAFTLDAEYIEEATFEGLPVVSFETLEAHYPPDEVKLFIPISPQKLNQVRAEKYHQAKARGYSFISYISSKATYYGTPVGENCFIFENNVIQPFVTIGDNCILWSGNHIGHHSTLGNHLMITSHVVVSGHVVIDDYTFIGVNATLSNGIHVAEKNVIGAGALVLKSTEPEQVFPGTATTVAPIPSWKIKSL